MTEEGFTISHLLLWRDITGSLRQYVRCWVRRKAQKSKRRVLPAFSGEKMQTGLNRFFFFFSQAHLCLFKDCVSEFTKKKKKRNPLQIKPKGEGPKTQTEMLCSICSVPFLLDIHTSQRSKTQLSLVSVVKNSACAIWAS